MTYGVINADLMTSSDGVNSAGLYGFKNRVINGNMMIDQRNAGASVTPANGAYTLDRWRTEQSGGGVYTVQQSTTAPAGFKNSLLVTVTTADSSIAAGDYYDFEQFIEGFNTVDLAWGTASASPVTLSFWVRSSVTGTFGGSLVNSAGDRAYVFTYAINAANTWEQKTVTVAGDTSGTWLTTSGRGIGLYFDLGNGSTYQGTAGSWLSSYAIGTSSSVKLISTVGATFYITGVQLEKGSTATSFDYRPYGTELALCQRYYYRMQNDGPGSGSFMVCAGEGPATMAGNGGSFPVTMRTTPTPVLGAGIRYYSPASGNITPTINGNRCSSTSMSLLLNGTSITAGQAGNMYNGAANGYVEFSSEL